MVSDNDELDETEEHEEDEKRFVKTLWEMLRKLPNCSAFLEDLPELYVVRTVKCGSGVKFGHGEDEGSSGVP